MAIRIKLSNEQISALKAFLDEKDGSAKELARAQAVFMLARKIDLMLINEITGFNRSAIFKWRKRFVEGGISGLLDKKKAAPKALLTKGQIQETLNTIRTETPRAFGYDTDFWTTTILGYLIKEQYNVLYKTKKPLYLLFKKAKFSFHKPGQQYRNRDQAKIDEWINNHKTELEKYLNDKDTVVLAGDEMVLSTQTTFQKIWLPVNDFPKIDVSNKRMNRSIYGFLNIQNGVEHAFKAEHQNSAITVKILERLCQNYKGKKIVLLWDNAPWHRSKEVRQWLTETKHNIYLIAFPPYAPELNPQEHVWKESRSQKTHNKFIERIDTTTDKLVDHLNNSLYKYSLLGIQI
jgi:transposase